jgi:hypothetical protein
VEKRTAKVNISAAGGTAAKGSRTCKVTLPTTWLEAMGISESQRELELSFDGEQITLSHPGATSVPEHNIRTFRFYDGQRLCTIIRADFTAKTVSAENHVVDPVKTAFGNNPRPSWADFQAFLEERCIPRQRAGLREYLEAIGVAEYDPLQIILKTKGRMAEDQQWLEVLP